MYSCLIITHRKNNIMKQLFEGIIAGVVIVGPALLAIVYKSF